MLLYDRQKNQKYFLRAGSAKIEKHVKTPIKWGFLALKKIFKKALDIIAAVALLCAPSKRHRASEMTAREGGKAEK
jgi:hypothetical protein